MERIYFTRLFTKGMLKGLIHHDSIAFPTTEGCVEWVKAINRKNARGKVDYKIVDKSFQQYVR